MRSVAWPLRRKRCLQKNAVVSSLFRRKKTEQEMPEREKIEMCRMMLKNCSKMSSVRWKVLNPARHPDESGNLVTDAQGVLS